MDLVIQVLALSFLGAAQPSMTAPKAVLNVTSK